MFSQVASMLPNKAPDELSVECLTVTAGDAVAKVRTATAAAAGRGATAARRTVRGKASRTFMVLLVVLNRILDVVVYTLDYSLTGANHSSGGWPV